MATPTPGLGLQLFDEGENYDVDLINANNTSIDTEVIALRKNPKGLIYRSVVVPDTANYGSAEGLVFNSIVTLVKDRWYEYTFRTQLNSAGPNQVIQLRLKKDTNSNDVTTFATGGTITNITTVNYVSTSPVANQPATEEMRAIFQATANETVNLKATGNLTVGPGTVFQFSNRIVTLVDIGMQI